MNIIEKDILTIESGIILHQVNCKGVMGAGLGKKIRDKWPKAFDEYKAYIDETKMFRGEGKAPDAVLLGEWCCSLVQHNIIVMHLFGQLDFGTKARQTDYCAITTALESMKERRLFKQTDIYFPYRFGCGFGGGDWNIVSEIFDYYLPNATCCKYEN